MTEDAPNKYINLCVCFSGLRGIAERVDHGVWCPQNFLIQSFNNL